MAWTRRFKVVDCATRQAIVAFASCDLAPPQASSSGELAILVDDSFAFCTVLIQAPGYIGTSHTFLRDAPPDRAMSNRSAGREDRSAGYRSSTMLAPSPPWRGVPGAQRAT